MALRPTAKPQVLLWGGQLVENALNIIIFRQQVGWAFLPTKQAVRLVYKHFRQPEKC
ncbi:MAG: hypothetical protein IJV56_09510 [Neisseriaceae bacterium]|nr:hypothetical protein [Neisseriaceae bacterium]